MTEEKEMISREDLNDLASAKAVVQTKLLLAQKAIAESQASELEWRNKVLQIFVKHGLKLTDSIDETTGEVTRNPVVEEVPANG